MKINFLVVCALLITSSLWSQPQWVQFNGTSAINSIKVVEDKVWCTSPSGLLSYDTTNHVVTHYKNANGEGAGSGSNDIVVDSARNIYVAFGDGVSKYDGTTWTNYHTTNAGDTLNGPIYISSDKNGKVWGVGEYVFYIDNTGLNAITPANSINNLPSPGAGDIDCDTNGHVYIATQKYGILIYDGTSWTSYDTTNSPVFSNYAIAVGHERNGMMWFIFQSNSIPTPVYHIYSFDGTTWNDYPAQTVAPGSRPGKIFIDRNNKKYFYAKVISSMGILEFDDVNWTVVDTLSGTITSNWVAAMDVDSLGKLWTNSFISQLRNPDTMMLSWYDGTALTEKVVSENPFDILEELFRDPDSNVYARCKKGIYKYTALGWVDISPPSTMVFRDFANDAVFDLNGVLWVVAATVNPSHPVIAKLDQGVWSYIDPAMGYIYNLNIDNSNNLWIAGSAHWMNAPLVKYDGTTFQYFNSTNAPVGNAVFNAAFDSQNNLWFSQTVSNVPSVVRYDGTNWTLFDSTNSSVNSGGTIFTTPSGRVFFNASYQQYPYSSVFEFNGTDFVYDTLINSVSTDGGVLLNEDALGRIWYAPGMNQGVFIFNSLALKDVLHPMNSGIAGSKILSLVFSNNQAWMCTNGGSMISVYNPQGISTLEPSNGNFISGTVYLDADTDGVFDAGESGMVAQKILLLPDSTSNYTNNAGLYRFNRNAGPYEASMIPYNGWNITSDSLSYQCVVDTVDIDSLDFGINNSNPFRAIEVDITAPRPRCHSTSLLFVTVKNTGTLIDSGTVQLDIDPNITVISSNTTPDSVNGNIYYYSYNALVPFQTISFNLTIRLPGNSGTNVTYTCLANGMQGITATDTVTNTVSCSFDPNEKVASPEGVQAQHYTLINDSIEYTIYFQNLGTDTAFSVVVYDSLDISLIDINSFQFIASSSPCFVSLTQSGLATFTFDPLALPNSAVNEAASHGFAKYRVKLKPTVSAYSELHNRAYIVFDFNPAIITNQTTNTLVQNIPLSVNDIHSSGELKIYPNPSSDKIRLVTGMRDYSISVYNAMGMRLIFNSSGNDDSVLDVSKLQSGVYYIVANDKTGAMRSSFIKID